MEKIEVSINGIHLLISVDDAKRVGIYNFSTKPFCGELPSANAPSVCIAEVKMTGADCNHMGAKVVGTVCPDELLYSSHELTDTPDGKLLAVTLKSSLLEVTQVYRFYNGTQTVRAWASVKNIGETPAGLEFVSSFAIAGLGRKGMDAAENFELYTPHNMWCEELHWNRSSLFDAGYNPIKQQSTKRIGFSSTGSWSTKEYLPMGALKDKETEGCMMWQIEHNGSWHWEISDVSGGELVLRLSGPEEHDNGWWKELKPGDTFETVKVAVALSDEGFGGTVRELTEYRRIIAAHVTDRDMPVVFNDYMGCLWAQPTTEKELPVIEKAAEAGAEIYVIDGGWYSAGAWWPLVGEWEESPERFPGGMKEVFDNIRAHGMIAGLWLEPEVMGINCPLVPMFEDCFMKRHGRNIIDRGRYQLDFRKKKTVDHLNKVVDRFVNDYGVKFMKLDYNIDCGVGTETDADSFGDGLMQCNKVFLDWVDSLYVRHPGILIENCSSGGMRMEYGSLQHFCLQSVSDSSLYHEFAYMSVMAPSAVIPEQTGIWVVPSPDQTDGQNVFAAVNGMLHRFYLSGKTHLLEGERFDLIKEAVAVHKEIRKNLIGSLSYFPLGICHYNDDWAVSARVGGDKKTLYVTAGRLKGEKSVEIPLSDIPGIKKNAEIIYPKNFGEPEITLKGETLTVTLEDVTALLIKLDLE